MNDENSERRISTSEIRDIAHSYHRIETRVAVLEKRIDTQDHRLTVIETDIRAIKIGMDRLQDMVATHIEIENVNRIKLLSWIITILLSVLGFGVANIIDWFR